VNQSSRSRAAYNALSTRNVNICASYLSMQLVSIRGSVSIFRDAFSARDKISRCMACAMIQGTYAQSTLSSIRLQKGSNLPTLKT